MSSLVGRVGIEPGFGWFWRWHGQALLKRDGLIAFPETIYALATAPSFGRAGSGIAVLRVSGVGCREVLLTIAGRRLPSPRAAVLRRLRHPRTGEVIDQGLVLWFPAPNSATGEDYAEFQVHGGRAVIAGMLEALAAIPGCRLARPGEFARRSFAHGKLDLTAVEGLADLVAAETAAQRRQALRQLEGELGRLYESWRERLIRVMAHVEAEIDFPDEDLPPGLLAGQRRDLAALLGELADHLADRRGERLREGICIAIVGAPNVGKSSILNRLARRDVAIVSPLPGTTRDLLEIHLDLGGYPATVIDTAGLRESEDPIEREGVRRARARAESADLRLRVELAGSTESAAFGDLPIGRNDIVVRNKADLLGGSDSVANPPSNHSIAISALTGAGFDRLVAVLSQRVAQFFGDGEVAGTEGALPAEAPPLTQHRHREALQRCHDALQRALAQADHAEFAAELLAEDLRLAARELGRITGRVDVEDILDVVFREFCIGK